MIVGTWRSTHVIFNLVKIKIIFSQKQPQMWLRKLTIVVYLQKCTFLALFESGGPVLVAS